MPLFIFAGGWRVNIDTTYKKKKGLGTLSIHQKNIEKNTKKITKTIDFLSLLLYNLIRK